VADSGFRAGGANIARYSKVSVHNVKGDPEGIFSFRIFCAAAKVRTEYTMTTLRLFSTLQWPVAFRVSSSAENAVAEDGS